MRKILAPMFPQSLLPGLVLALLGNILCVAEETKSPSVVVAAPFAAVEGVKQPAPGPTAPTQPIGPPSAMGQPPGRPAMQPKPGDAAKPVQRPPKPPTPPNAEELKVRPDAEGQVRFNFNNQPWPAVLEWLAQVSNMSLDWQDLPGDYLNLSTQRSYTIQETRDLINRHLLARGYTMLCQGELMTVANIKTLDPSLVPRVKPDELERRSPYDFVKVSFPLDWFLAETVVDELKPMLSPNGKLTALTESNRIEAMDAAGNLCAIHRMLEDEQSGENQQRLVREFLLTYARAADVRDQLQTLLGLARSGSAGSGSESKPGVVGQPGQPSLSPTPTPSGPPSQLPVAVATKTKPAAAISLVVNQRKNSILVHAQPDKMAIIEQAIKAIDVPIDRSQSPLANMGRMRVYRLVGVEPEPIVKTLETMGNLDPTTRLEIDPKNKTIIAYATLADHVMIQAIVEKLSGSERSFEVRQLHRLSADEVAGTVVFMMGREPKKEKQRSMPWWFGGESNRESTAERPDAFRVDADVEHNRLLLWANEIELAEVDKLLVKLGEISTKDRRGETTRVLDSGSVEETKALIERIRRVWPSVAPNPLMLPPAAPKEEKPEELLKDPKDQKDQQLPEKPSVSPSGTTAQRPTSDIFQFVGLHGEAAGEDTAASPPPVKLGIGPDGKLIISSEDTEALDRLEEMVAELKPARKDYQMFRLKYADAYIVSLNLEEFFKGEQKKQSRPWWAWDSESTDDKDAGLRLSKRRELEFISDFDTNSILVKGADREQLKTVKDLIDIYDQPPPHDSQSVRQTKVFCLQYAKATTVSDAIKDVYRDLLSANDKALRGGDSRQRESQIRYIFSYDDTEQKTQKSPKFKGMLSIGIDDDSNALVVSAPGFLFDDISKLIQELDEAAASNNAVRIVKVGPGISAAGLQAVLEDALNEGSSRGSSAKGRESSKQSNRTKQKSGSPTGDSRSSDGD